MPLIDLSQLAVIERLPGWRGRYFHTGGMTFAHYDFTAGAEIHAHAHEAEEVYEVLDGELELTIDGEPCIARPGIAAVVPSNVVHGVRALTDGRVIIIDHPARREFG